ncbi:hypothetical protein C8R44DRAFT_888499 [Mycena epipterygia]|nr:hypothetical protein C8R44DRAFT_888499 [Mycena epipterygia]
MVSALRPCHDDHAAHDPPANLRASFLSRRRARANSVPTRSNLASKAPDTMRDTKRTRLSFDDDGDASAFPMVRFNIRSRPRRPTYGGNDPDPRHTVETTTAHDSNACAPKCEIQGDGSTRRRVEAENYATEVVIPKHLHSADLLASSLRIVCAFSNEDSAPKRELEAQRISY